MRLLISLVLLLTSVSHASSCVEFLHITSSSCSEHPSSTDYYMDCSDRGLTEVQPYWFTCQIQTLNLDRNEMTRLTNGSFVHIFNLRSFSARWNKISSLDPSLFDHLNNLEHINLDFNQLVLFEPDSIPDGIFYDTVLPNLKVIYTFFCHCFLLFFIFFTTKPLGAIKAYIRIVW